MTLVDKLYKRDIEEAYQRGAADAREALLAEVCAWLQDNHIGENRHPDWDRYIADAIKAKFKATG